MTTPFAHNDIPDQAWLWWRTDMSAAARLHRW
jgi:hypothetical protein